MKRKRGSQDIIKEANNLSTIDFAAKHFAAGNKGGNGGTTPQTGVSQVEHNGRYNVQLLSSPLAPQEISSESLIGNDLLLPCLDLIEQTSSEDYRHSAIGWNRQRKLNEMRDTDMRYLIVTDHRPEQGVASPVMGFSSFMLTYEDGLPVIYIYEIHLKPAARGTGLGKRLMALVTDIGRSVGVKKAMLTVFIRNEVARRWYAKLGFTVDEFNPQEKRLRGGRISKPDYEILSKSLE